MLGLLLAMTLHSTAAADGDLAGRYVSLYAGYRRELVIAADGAYRFIETKDGALEARDAGRATLADGFVTLHPTTPTIRTADGHLASEFHPYRLLVLEHAGVRRLIDEEDLSDVGMQIEWNGRLGARGIYQRMRDGDEPVDGAGTDGPTAPPRSALPAALQAWVFERPVIATITGVVPDVSRLDNFEILVRIDRGRADRFRMNLPLCSPDATPRLKGWVLDVSEHASTVRIDLPDPLPTDPLHYARIGERLTTRQCDWTTGDPRP